MSNITPPRWVTRFLLWAFFRRQRAEFERMAKAGRAASMERSWGRFDLEIITKETADKRETKS